MSRNVASHPFATACGFMQEPGYIPATERAPLAAPPVNKFRQNVLLPRNRAVTFAPREDTRLRLTEGRLWITFEAPKSRLAPRNGDHFVSAGEVFDFLAGETAVMESVAATDSALFDLEPALSLPWRAMVQQLAATLRRRLGAARPRTVPASRERQRC